MMKSEARIARAAENVGLVCDMLSRGATMALGVVGVSAAALLNTSVQSTRPECHEIPVQAGDTVASIMNDTLEGFGRTLPAMNVVESFSDFSVEHSLDLHASLAAPALDICLTDDGQRIKSIVVNAANK